MLNVYIRDFKESQRDEYLHQVIDNRPDLVMQACKIYNEQEGTTLNPLDANDAVTALDACDIGVAKGVNIDDWEIV